MEYDTDSMYNNQSNFEKYQAAKEARRGIDELLEDIRGSIIKSYGVAAAVMFMSIPIANLSLAVGGGILFSGIGYIIYNNFFKYRAEIKNGNHLKDRFEEEEIKFRHAWMSESFSSASKKTSDNHDNARREGARGARGNYYEQQHQRERESAQQEFDDFFRHNRNNYNRNNHSKQQSSSSYGVNEQRGTFKDCVTVKDVKKVYRSKAKKHHPDVGGDAETFKSLVIQYERALEIAQRIN